MVALKFGYTLHEQVTWRRCWVTYLWNECRSSLSNYLLLLRLPISTILILDGMLSTRYQRFTFFGSVPAIRCPVAYHGRSEIHPVKTDSRVSQDCQIISVGSRQAIQRFGTSRQCHRRRQRQCNYGLQVIESSPSKSYYDKNRFKM